MELDANTFPLVQLPKKFKGSSISQSNSVEGFPLVQLPKKFKEWIQSVLT